MITKAYDSATKNPVEVTELVDEDVSKTQVRIDWLQSDMTRRLFKELSDDSSRLITEAIGLVLAEPQTNQRKIEQKLIQADMLRKVVGKYATLK